MDKKEQTTLTDIVLFLQGKYSHVLDTLEKLAELPDDVYPEVDGKRLSEKEKKGFMLGIQMAINILGGNLDARIEKHKDTQQKQTKETS